MTLEDLIALYRAQAHDNSTPPFCDDDLLLIYANEAQDEACRRSELLRDSSSPFCSVAVAPGAETIDLDKRILKVLRASMQGRLDVVSLETMESIAPHWMDDGATGRTAFLVEGVTTGKLHLWPKPAAAGTIRLTVQRLPLVKLANDTDAPEIRSEAHAALVDWMMYRAYNRGDTDLYNESKAQVGLGLFEREFGTKSSVRNEQWARNGAGSMPGPIA